METTNSGNRHWQDAVNLVLGLWSISSPWIIGFADTHAGNAAQGGAVVFGVAVVIVSIAGLISPDIWQEWINLLLGTILVVSPAALWFLSYPTGIWTVVLTGIAIDIVAISSLREQILAMQHGARQEGGGTITGTGEHSQEHSHAGR